MVRPRYRKLIRDLWLARGRVGMMVAAIAVSIAGIGSLLAADAILNREIRRNYLETSPPSATLETSGLDAALVAQVNARPDIAAATARSTVLARIQVGPDRWRPLLLFVVSPGDPLRMARFSVEQGTWPPPSDGILLERSGLEMLGVEPGGSLTVRTPSGTPRQLRLTGVVHDPSLAPSWQERTGYGYVSAGTLAYLGDTQPPDELKIIVAGDPASAAAIERTAQDVAGWLATQGHPVSEIQIPPPLQHPHQAQMNAVLLMFLAFAAMTVLLSAVLVAAIVSGMLSQQVRQIGVLKAVGARTDQILSMYLLMMLAVGATATILGILPTVLLGRAMSGVVADLLNLDLVDQSVPWWVFAVQVAAGVLVPIAVALVPILRGSRITVRQAIDDYGIDPGQSTGGRLERWATSFRGLDRSILLPLRNTVRRRGRLLLTVGLLSVGGGLFMTGLNTADAWNRALDDGLAQRHFDLEVRLERPVAATAVTTLLRDLPGVSGVEAWRSAPTGVTRPGQVEVVRTYPDGGHGSFTLVAPPGARSSVDSPLLAGRWLEPGDTDAIVLNQLARAQIPDVRVGDRVQLTTAGRIASWRVVGIVQEVLNPATGYVTNEAFGRAVDQPGLTNLVRVVTVQHDANSRAAVMQAVEHALAGGSVAVSLALPITELRAALDGHVLVLVGVLILTAILTALVGSLGLATTMSINVLERTREFGIMHALGASARMVRRIVITEGVTLGAVSWLVALALALPLSRIVGAVIGSMTFRLDLPLVVSPVGALLWLAIAVVGSAVASAAPARRASRLTVREALAYS